MLLELISEVEERTLINFLYFLVILLSRALGLIIKRY